jgi:hypothetical protein
MILPQKKEKNFNILPHSDHTSSFTATFTKEKKKKQVHKPGAKARHDACYMSFTQS